MFFYIKLTERACEDPQEARAFAAIREKSLLWLREMMQFPGTGFRYAFRNKLNNTAHYFVEVKNNHALHELIDPDPIISYCYIDIEPLLTAQEMVDSLQLYLKEQMITEEDHFELTFPVRQLSNDLTYFLARKVVMPFSPLLTVEEQNKIHYNTLLAQTAHLDEREIIDYNPACKPVGLLVMQAENEQEVLEHVKNCEVFVDTRVHIEELLTVENALLHNQQIIEYYKVGCLK